MSFDRTFIDLSSLEPDEGAQLNGFVDRTGATVIGIGDINDDGFDDAAIATIDDPFLFVLLGDQRGIASQDLADLGQRDGFRIDTSQDFRDGITGASAAGDFNGDGIDDFAFSSSRNDTVTVVFGSDTPVPRIVDGTLNGRLDTATFEGRGGDLRRFGENISNIGDFNGDGFDDLLVESDYSSSRPNFTTILFGQADPNARTNILSTDESQSITFVGGLNPDIFQNTPLFSGVGDINGDGFDDFAVGDRSSGEVLVVFGTDTQIEARGELRDQAQSNGLVRTVGNSAETMRSISGIGDFNGDGLDDFAIGLDRGRDEEGTRTGLTYIVFGDDSEDGAGLTSLDFSDLSAEDGFVIAGPSSLSGFGHAVSGAGDVNGDGFDDIIIGAPDVDAAGYSSDTGQAFIIFGSRDTPVGEITIGEATLNSGIILNGFSIDSDGASSVAGIGDFNGDGFDDVMAGAPEFNDRDGQAFVVFGGPETRDSLDLTAGLLTGSSIDTGVRDEQGRMVIPFAFLSTGDVLISGEDTFRLDNSILSYERGRIQSALNFIEAVLNVDFQLTTDRSDAVMEFGASETGSFFQSDNNLGLAFLPDDEPIGSTVIFNIDGVGWDRNSPNIGGDASNGGLEIGGLGFATIVHEIGHALGIGHPFDSDQTFLFPGLIDNDLDGVADDPFGDAGAFDLNQDVFSVMSQTRDLFEHPFLGVEADALTSGNPRGFMPIDIAALQILYGANETLFAGDNTHTLELVTGDRPFYDTVWDSAGIDRIRYLGDADAVIDLRPATLQVEAGGGGFVSTISSAQGGLFIGAGVVIENGQSGNGNDSLRGNDIDNHLDGGGGHDSLSGANGQDTLIGGAGNDTLIGGVGGDQNDGGDGFDFVSFADADRRVQVDTTNRIGGIGDAAGDVFTSIEGIIGTRFNDNLRGGNEDNDIQAGGFSDRLFGRGGDDTLDGGDGADAIFGNSGADEMTGGGGRDRFIYFRVTETGVGEGNRDVITDFDAAAGERMEIRRFDADTTQGFRQAFDFIGADAFSNTAGELRFDQSSGLNTIIQADTNGDGLADFEIELTGLITLTEANFLI